MSNHLQCVISYYIIVMASVSTSSPSEDCTSGTDLNNIPTEEEKQIKRKCILKTINRTTNLYYSLDGYLWAISALAAEKLQIRCVMETNVITVKPPLQIVDIGNGCEALLLQHLHTS